MSVKIFPLYTCSATILLICFLGHIPISNATVGCRYVKDGDTRPYIKWCPDACCSMRPTPENATCCAPPIVYISTTSTTSAFTIFGYAWWRIFLVAICLCTAISILIHYVKRIHIFKHSKNLNSMVEPVAAFTISKNELNMIYNDKSIASEEKPPIYTAAPSPPPYASTIKFLE